MKNKLGLLLSLFLLLAFAQLIKISFVQSKEQEIPSINSSFNNKKNITEEKNYREGEVIVKYKNKEKLEEKLENINKGETKKNLTSINKDISERKITLLKSEEKNTDDLIKELKNDENIESVEPNYLREFSFVPDDTYFIPYQWSHLNAGQKIYGTTGTVDADTDITEAWDIEESSATQMIVAVLDSGVFYSHPDLTANMWDGSSCVDEDNSSIVGGCPNHGWDFENDDNDPNDDLGHGTRVASIIGSTSGNSTGIAGISRYNNIKVMALRFGSDVFTEIDGINFAKNNGAKVINGSFSGTGYSNLEKNAIDSFDGIFVAASGNGSGDGVGDNNDILHQYPCDYTSENIICVAASDQNDTLADFSNYSISSVDLAAPGVNIIGIENYPDEDYASGYILGDGTSFATPLVTGTVGLLYAHNPTASTSTIKDSLLKSSDHLANLSGKTVCSRRLNTNKSLLSIINETIPPETCAYPVYRFWSDAKQGHFFTINASEKDFIIANDYSWKYEGVAYKTFRENTLKTTPIYRFWSDAKQHHFFTASALEKNYVIANDHSWTYEGIAYYAYSTQQSETTPVYRFWSDTKQGHFFTSSASEKDFIITNDSSWNYEGIAWYVPIN